MTAKLNPRSARRHLQAFQFADLFIEDLGWNYPDSEKPIHLTHEASSWQAQEISQLAGYRVFEITPDDPDTPFPSSSTQQALWRQMTPHSAENILIFLDAQVPEQRSRSLWLWMKRETDPAHPHRSTKNRPRRHHYLKGQPGDLFLSKLSALVIDLSELDEDGNLPITEAAERVRTGLDIEVVTKTFFDDFQLEHQHLLDSIGGVFDPDERRWYASVLLNRLMFIWFLQKKGFIDVRKAKTGNLHYLVDKLAASREQGEDRFYSHFLRDLFFEGFAKPEERRSPIGSIPLGDIPYLNGGLFLPHGIEVRIEGDSLHSHAYRRIHIPDAAFDSLFALFDRYSWSLNDTPGGDDREINPDVLGYIFEKYINQKEFGAYYTRPEVTDYLCERTVHPLVLDRVNAAYPAKQKLHKSEPKSFPEPRYYHDLEDLLLHVDGPTAATLLQNILPSLSILDPACGSGAFLVAAQKTLLNLYTALIGRCQALNYRPILQWIEYEQKQHKAPIAYWLKKKIVTENLYGVDIMEEAGEIAKLRLFLSLVASAEERNQLEPLPNIEFNLLAGNSLIGLLRVDAARFDAKAPRRTGDKGIAAQPSLGLRTQEALGFETELSSAITHKEKAAAFVAGQQVVQYKELLRRKNQLIDNYKKSTSLFQDLAGLKSSIEELKADARKILDKLLLDEFHALGVQFEQATWDESKKKEGKCHKRGLRIEDIRALTPFHWAYEFDEVMENRGGFDLIITNPPWDILKPNAKEFFEHYSGQVTKKKMPIEDFEKEKKSLLVDDPEIRQAWLEYLSSFPYQSAYFRSSPQYENQIGQVNGRKVGSDINLYKLFLEQCTHLLAEGARCGIVIPSGIYTDLGATQLRNMLYEKTKIEGLFGFENRRKIFEGVDSRFKFVVLTFETAGTTESFPVAFMRQDVRDLATFPNPESLTLSPRLIRRLSPGSGSMMEFNSSEDLAIAEKLLRHPLLGETVPDAWNIGFTAEFHMTNDSNLFHTTPGTGRLPLYEGKMIWQFRHGYAEPRYWVEEEEGRARLIGRTGDLGQKLDYQDYRLGFRDIARNTDTRTLISTIIPPTFHGNKIPTVKTYERGSCLIGLQEQLVLCALLNSFVIDWVIRQKVTTTLNYFYMNQLPIPRLTATDTAFRPLIERAARLIGTAADFDALLAEVFGASATHQTHGITDPQERLTLRAQIDALVARLYDLTVPEFQHILTTFPLVDTATKSQTLNAYRELVRLGEFV